MKNGDSKNFPRHSVFDTEFKMLNQVQHDKKVSRKWGQAELKCKEGGGYRVKYGMTERHPQKTDPR